jgi:hypothetical protein
MSIRRNAAAWISLLASVVLAMPALRAAIHPLTPGQEVPRDPLPGPLRLAVRPSDDRDRGQPLLAIGNPAGGSLLFWLWDAEGKARIGFEDTQHGLSFSPAFAAAADQTHVIDVAWGALWPAEAPASAGLSAALRDTLWVAVDGQTLLFRKQAFSLRTTQVIFGANVIGSALVEAFFHGPLATVEPGDTGLVGRIGMPLPDLISRRDLRAGGYPGPLQLTLSLPVGVAGRNEPLLVGGHAGAAAFFYVHYDDERHMQIGYDAWGLRGPLSAPFAYRPGADYKLRLSVGFLYPPADRPPRAGDAPLALLPAVLWAEWDGRPALATVTSSPTVPPGEITLGANLIGWNLTDAVFRGLFSRIEPLDPSRLAAGVDSAIFTRIPAPGPAWEGYPGTVRLRLAFPEVWQPGVGEPLVVAGPTGAADILYVNYEDGGRLHLGVDHWGAGALTSASIAVAPGSEHVLTIGLGALYPPEGAPLYGEHPELAAQRESIRVDLDGQVVLHGLRAPYRVPPEQITYGINLAGGSMSGPSFTGRILQMEAVPAEAAASGKPGGRSPGIPRPATPPSP